jgi:LPS-assembly protein
VANTLRLDGGVLAVQGNDVAVADAAVLDLSARSAVLSRAVVYLKQGATPALRALTDRGAARGTGKNALTLTAQRVQQLPGNVLLAREVTLTPCDCAGSPDYEIIAGEARVTGDRVALSSPRLHIGVLRIPLFPLSLPLGDRQSGLLFPRFGFSSTTGFAFAVPIFQTLGRSYDATITPGFFTGNPGSATANLISRSVKGPRLGLELRYAPAERTQGEVALDLFQDLDRGNSLSQAQTVNPAVERPATAGRGLPFANGLRGTFRYLHRTEKGALVLAAEGMLASDSMVIADALPPTALERYLGSLRNDFGLWSARGPVSVGFDATVLQDLRLDNPLVVPSVFEQPDRRLFGPEARPYPARLPAAFAQVAPVELGPVAFSAELSAVRFQSLGGPTGLERATGYSPTDLSCAPVPPNLCGAVPTTTPIPSTDPLGLARARVVRLDASPRLSAALPDGLPLRARVLAGARADAWLFEDDPVRDTRRAYALAGAEAGTAFARSYGSVLHTVEPFVEVRALSHALRSGGPPIGDPGDAGGSTYTSNPDAAVQGLALFPGLALDPNAGGNTRGVPAARRPYDEVDFAAPEGGAGEFSLRVQQALWTRGAPGHAPGRIAALELRQDFVLWLGGGRARAGEASATASFALGPASASALVRYDWDQRALTSLSGAASLRDARGDDLHSSLLVLNGTQSARLRAGIDELFAAVRLAPLNPQVSSSVGLFAVGGNWMIPATENRLRASADALRHIGPLVPNDGQADWTLRGQLLYETPCHCAGFVVAAEQPFRNGRTLRSPTIRVLIDLKSLGSISTF